MAKRYLIALELYVLYNALLMVAFSFIFPCLRAEEAEVFIYDSCLAPAILDYFLAVQIVGLGIITLLFFVYFGLRGAGKIMLFVTILSLAAILFHYAFSWVVVERVGATPVYLDTVTP